MSLWRSYISPSSDFIALTEVMNCKQILKDLERFKILIGLEHISLLQ